MCDTDNCRRTAHAILTAPWLYNYCCGGMPPIAKCKSPVKWSETTSYPQLTCPPQRNSEDDRESRWRHAADNKNNKNTTNREQQNRRPGVKSGSGERNTVKSTGDKSGTNWSRPRGRYIDTFHGEDGGPRVMMMRQCQ